MLETVAPTSSPAVAQKKLLQLVSAVPFGDKLACGKAANELLLAMNEPVKRIESEFGTRRQHAWALIERLSRAEADAIIDYATGRQVMWSITLVGISNELLSGPGMFVFHEDLFEELERRANYEPTGLHQSLQRIHQAFSQSP